MWGAKQRNMQRKAFSRFQSHKNTIHGHARRGKQKNVGLLVGILVVTVYSRCTLFKLVLTLWCSSSHWGRGGILMWHGTSQFFFRQKHFKIILVKSSRCQTDKDRVCNGINISIRLWPTKTILTLSASPRDLGTTDTISFFANWHPYPLIGKWWHVTIQWQFSMSIFQTRCQNWVTLSPQLYSPYPK